MVLKQKGLMSGTMKNNRTNNDSRLGVLKKMMRKKLSEIKQDRNSKKQANKKIRKNDSEI